jgi:phosphatidylinositol alpha 1,6-mannosyltransferase
VVSAAAGGPLDLVTHDSNGLLWHGDDPDVLAELIAQLRDDPARLGRLAFHARPSVVHRTWTRVTDELVAHYRSVITARQALSKAS